MNTEAAKIGILKVIQFLWSQRKLILAIIPLVLEAQRRYSMKGDRKKWVMDTLEELKRFTPDEVDAGIDYVVQLLQAMGILPRE
jgi:hypothetical protein